MNIYIETHGCTFNQADSEIMSGIIKEEHKITKNIEDADVIILNTCYVKEPTEQKMITKIHKIQNNYPEKKLIIAGCMVEVDTKKLSKIANNNCWIGPHKINHINEVIKQASENKVVHEYGKTRELKVCKHKIRENPLIHILQICEGCQGSCTFCCTKIARGDLFSYPTDMLVKEAEEAINDGCKEIQVTAQDTACYGLDSNEPFSELLNKICNLDGDYRVRVGMMHPKSLKVQLEEVIKVFKDNPKLYKFVHIPVQTGSEKVLKEMVRKHTLEEFKYMIKRFREEIPTISIATDIIVGYPTETEKDFQQTLDLLKEIKPDIIHISKYMHRPGAISSKLKAIDHDVMKDRSHRLNDVKTEVMYENNKKYIGTKQTALIISEGHSGGYLGYTNSYKNIIVDEAEIGSFIDVEITDGKRTYLSAKPI